MRLFEYLALILKAHGELLRSISETVGENILIEILERHGENLEEEPLPTVQSIEDLEDPSPLSAVESSPYDQLQDAVESLRLPKTLEFYVWSYPYYRAFIECPTDLSSHIRHNDAHSDEDQLRALMGEAKTQAQKWLDQLPITEEFQIKFGRILEQVWVRFHTHTLKSWGYRPLEAVSTTSEPAR